MPLRRHSLSPYRWALSPGTLPMSQTLSLHRHADHRNLNGWSASGSRDPRSTVAATPVTATREPAQRSVGRGYGRPGVRVGGTGDRSGAGQCHGDGGTGGTTGGGAGDHDGGVRTDDHDIHYARGGVRDLPGYEPDLAQLRKEQQRAHHRFLPRQHRQRAHDLLVRARRSPVPHRSRALLQCRRPRACACERQTGLKKLAGRLR
jgi:hypothetical protein